MLSRRTHQGLSACSHRRRRRYPVAFSHACFGGVTPTRTEPQAAIDHRDLTSPASNNCSISPATEIRATSTAWHHCPQRAKLGNGIRDVSFAPLRGLIPGKGHQTNDTPKDNEDKEQEHSGRIRQIARRFAAKGAVDDLVQDIQPRLRRSYAGFRGDSKVESRDYR